jgi:hypothetical protein
MEGINMNKQIKINISLLFSLICIFSLNVINAQEASGPSLVQAIAESPIDQIKSMISGGANVNEKNSLGWTPLHAAVRFANIEAVKLLLESNADINAKDNSGQTPLYAAVETGQKELVDLLISKKADVNITNSNNENALSLARMVGLKTIEDVLVKNNAVLPVPIIQNQAAPNQEAPGNRMGMPGQGMRGNRMGGPRGNGMNNAMNPENVNPQGDNNTEMPEILQNMNDSNSIALDPNEVKERIQKYPDFEKAVADIVSGNRNVERQWTRIDEDNRTLLVSATRRQFESEMEFVKKVAIEEKALKTSEAVTKLIESRKDKFASITREVRDELNQQEKQSSTRTTTTSSRRSTNRTTTTTTTRSNRRGGNTANETQSNADARGASTKEQARKYAPEVQSEIDNWLNADVLNISGRMEIMSTVNDSMTTEINSVKTIATGEKAEKTIAAIDVLLVERQKCYDNSRKALEKEMQNDSELSAPLM